MSDSVDPPSGSAACAPLPRLTSAELERLAKLSEECGEVIQVIGKIQRHGYASTHPNDPNGANNRALLEKELGDVIGWVDVMACAGDVGDYVEERRHSVLRRAWRYLHHQTAELYKRVTGEEPK